MATVYATVRRAVNAVIGKGDGGNLRALGARTIEVAAGASGTIIDFKLRVPLDMRIDALSRLYHDDLATSGSPTLDLGFYPVDGNFTADDDALTDGVAVSAVMTASTQTIGVPVIKDYANAGKRVWEFINGATVDTKGFADIKGIIRDAATTATGTVTLDIKAYDD
jgi:hypothetical protein